MDQGIIIRRLGEPGFWQLSAAGLARAAAALERARGLLQHPRKAEQLMLVSMYLNGGACLSGRNGDGRAPDLSILLDYAAPDDLTYSVPAHRDTSATGREIVAGGNGAGKHSEARP